MYRCAMYGLVLSLVAASVPASADTLSQKVDLAYLDKIAHSSSAQLGLALAGHLAGVAGACGAGSFGIVVSFVADSLPIVDVYTTWGSSYGGHYTEDGTDTSAEHVFLGGAITAIGGTLIVSPIKWLSGDKNGYYKNTRLAYSMTREMFDGVFRDPESDCAIQFAKAMIVKSELYLRDHK